MKVKVNQFHFNEQVKIYSYEELIKEEGIYKYKNFNDVRFITLNDHNNRYTTIFLNNDGDLMSGYTKVGNAEFIKTDEKLEIILRS